MSERRKQDYLGGLSKPVEDSTPEGTYAGNYRDPATLKIRHDKHPWETDLFKPFTGYLELGDGIRIRFVNGICCLPDSVDGQPGEWYITVGGQTPAEGIPMGKLIQIAKPLLDSSVQFTQEVLNSIDREIPGAEIPQSPEYLKGWQDCLEAVRSSLRDYPNAGGDEQIMKEVERLREQAVTQGMVERGAKPPKT